MEKKYQTSTNSIIQELTFNGVIGVFYAELMSLTLLSDNWPSDQPRKVFFLKLECTNTDGVRVWTPKVMEDNPNAHFEIKVLMQSQYRYSTWEPICTRMHLNKREDTSAIKRREEEQIHA